MELFSLCGAVQFSIFFFILNKKRFLFSSEKATSNQTIIETLNAYLNARLNERPHEEGYGLHPMKLWLSIINYDR